MCDGYIPFARAFVKGDIDTRGYEVAYSAYENAPEVPVDARTPQTQGKGTPDGLWARIRCLRGR